MGEYCQQPLQIIHFIFDGVVVAGAGAFFQLAIIKHDQTFHLSCVCLCFLCLLAKGFCEYYHCSRKKLLYVYVYMHICIYVHFSLSLYIYVYIAYKWDPGPVALQSFSLLHGWASPPNYALFEVYMIKWPGRGFLRAVWEVPGLGWGCAGVMRCNERIRMHQSRASGAVTLSRRGRFCGHDITL